MNNIKQQYNTNISTMNVSNDMYDVSYEQIKRLIQQNHWTNFRTLLRSIHKEGQIN